MNEESKRYSYKAVFYSILGIIIIIVYLAIIG